MKTIITIWMVFICTAATYCQEQPDSLSGKNCLKLDLIPLYHVLFDNRVQIRSGLEYEHYISDKSSVACYLDLGLYDKYVFSKYYDFFNQAQGPYSVTQKVSTTGFHFLPSWNYYFLRFKKASSERVFISTILDIGHYQKQTSSHNTLTGEATSGDYNQTKAGMGAGIGLKNYYGQHFFIELKTSLFLKVFNHLSKIDKTEIKSLDAQWTSHGYKLWWISNFKLGYGF